MRTVKIDENVSYSRIYGFVDKHEFINGLSDKKQNGVRVDVKFVFEQEESKSYGDMFSTEQRSQIYVEQMFRMYFTREYVQKVLQKVSGKAEGLFWNNFRVIRYIKEKVDDAFINLNDVINGDMDIWHDKVNIWYDEVYTPVYKPIKLNPPVGILDLGLIPDYVKKIVTQEF